MGLSVYCTTSFHILSMDFLSWYQRMGPDLVFVYITKKIIFYELTNTIYIMYEKVSVYDYFQMAHTQIHENNVRKGMDFCENVRASIYIYIYIYI